MFTVGFSKDAETSSVQLLEMYLEIFDNKRIRHFCASPFLYVYNIFDIHMQAEAR